MHEYTPVLGDGWITGHSTQHQAIQFNYLTWSISTYKLLVMFWTMMKEASLKSLAISSDMYKSVSKVLWKPDSERAWCKVMELFTGRYLKLKMFSKLGWMLIFDADKVCINRRSYKRERGEGLGHFHRHDYSYLLRWPWASWKHPWFNGTVSLCIWSSPVAGSHQLSTWNSLQMCRVDWNPYTRNQSHHRYCNL